MSTYKIGAISFLNSRPLFYGIERGINCQGLELSYDLPAVSSEKVAAGLLDVAIVPTIQYARIEGLKIVPGMSISSVGSVGSVNLFCNCPLQEISRIAVDERSRTSVALLKILCRDLYNIQPEFLPMPPEGSTMLAENDACLIIGDNALYFRGDYSEMRDLSSDWFELTGLPFVFAFLAGGSKSFGPAQVSQLQQSLALGLKNTGEIARSHLVDGVENLVEVNRRYLEENINYQLSDKHLEGLKLYYRKAAELGLINGVPELRFFDEE